MVLLLVWLLEALFPLCTSAVPNMALWGDKFADNPHSVKQRDICDRGDAICDGFLARACVLSCGVIRCISARSGFESSTSQLTATACELWLFPLTLPWSTWSLKVARLVLLVMVSTTLDHSNCTSMYSNKSVCGGRLPFQLAPCNC